MKIQFDNTNKHDLRIIHAVDKLKEHGAYATNKACISQIILKELKKVYREKTL